MTSGAGRHRAAALLSAAIVGMAISSCGGDGGTTVAGDPRPAAKSPTASETAPSDAPRLTTERDADLHLWVSNQSFIDDPMTLTVSIDGVVLVDQPFKVEGQHNWILFPIRLDAGPHEVRAVSQNGEVMEARFRVPADAPRYANINYWHYPGDPRLIDWRIEPRPIYFA